MISAISRRKLVLLRWWCMGEGEEINAINGLTKSTMSSQKERVFFFQNSRKIHGWFLEVSRRTFGWMKSDFFALPRNLIHQHEQKCVRVAKYVYCAHAQLAKKKKKRLKKREKRQQTVASLAGPAHSVQACRFTCRSGHTMRRVRPNAHVR